MIYEPTLLSLSLLVCEVLRERFKESFKSDGNKDVYNKPSSQALSIFVFPMNMQTDEGSMRSFMVYISMYFHGDAHDVIRHRFKVWVDKKNIPSSRVFVDSIKDYISSGYYSSPDVVSIWQLCVFGKDLSKNVDLYSNDEFLDGSIAIFENKTLFMRFLGRC